MNYIYTSLYLQVNTNGVLTFDQPFHVPNPQPFPYMSLRKISPFWENIDTSRNGRIYYRNTTDVTLLRRARFRLQDIFPSAGGFSPRYLFIATWDGVSELGLAGDPSLVSLIVLGSILYRQIKSCLFYLAANHVSINTCTYFHRKVYNTEGILLDHHMC